MLKFALGVAAMVIGVAMATTLWAQFPGGRPDRDGDGTNPTLMCDTRKALDRDGDIIWLQMTCRANRR